MALSLAALSGALWLGVLASISPCPLATNVVAISFIARHAGRARAVVAAGAAYTGGRALAYAGVAAVVVAGLLSIPTLSDFLQRHLNQALGPLLVLVGMFLLDLLPLPAGWSLASSGLQERAGRSGPAGAAALGFLFALSFCPVSAALFFGSLIPLAFKESSPLLLPALFGVGSALPALAATAIVASGSSALPALMRRVTTFDLWARRITGAIFVLGGIYLTLKYVFLVDV